MLLTPLIIEETSRENLIKKNVRLQVNRMIPNIVPSQGESEGIDNFSINWID